MRCAADKSGIKGYCEGQFRFHGLVHKRAVALIFSLEHVKTGIMLDPMFFCFLGGSGAGDNSLAVKDP